jgi:hypothetical protein
MKPPQPVFWMAMLVNNAKNADFALRSPEEDGIGEPSHRVRRASRKIIRVKARLLCNTLKTW